MSKANRKFKHPLDLFLGIDKMRKTSLISKEQIIKANKEIKERKRIEQKAINKYIFEQKQRTKKI
jgi:hypothetical protein